MNGIAAALHAALTGDTTISTLLGGPRVYQDEAPQGTAYPFLVFTHITSADSYTFSSRAWVDTLWQVRAYDQARSSARCGSLLAAVDAALTDKVLTVAGTAAMVVRRAESLPNLPETNEAGQPIRSAGARFQIGVHNA